MATCVKCTAAIKDHFFLKALDGYWHESCLCCHACDGNLSQLGSSLYFKHGNVFCKNDYLRLFGPTAKCAACQNQVYGNDLVIRKDSETVYHFSCFNCTNCRRAFCVGDKCVTDKITGKVFCLDNGCRQTKERKPRKTKKAKET
ncbi:LIM domain only protein 3-like [Hydractinia symbiolongicarpus]|uniref:LIM domain only protein 3-like n=1 Tax=Hydractinia symbiolongicarpus TaxID=13093 RepID=UPI00254E143F|nr:LIM domain only protein 3-like [Hydractinia symbiolongicarpus]XP_057316515.1 LIM domain only protein 3-like [Hydractinia symbiolongicarpus]